MQWVLLAILIATLVLAANAVAVYVAWRALFHDRARGRRRCPRCWHDLSHTPGLVCSECGHAARNESDLGRTRRRPVVAAAAIAACCLMAGTIYWNQSGGNWAGYLPSRALIAALPVVRDLNGPIYQEVARRAARGELTIDQWTALLRCAGRGDGRHKLNGSPWLAKYRQLVSYGLQQHRATDDAALRDGLTEALLDVPPFLQLSSRSTWPIGAPPRVHLEMHEWWPGGGDCRLHITPQIDGAEPVVVQRTGRRRVWAGYSFALPPLDEQTRTVAFDVRIEQLRPADDPLLSEAWTTMSEQTVRVPMRAASRSATTPVMSEDHLHAIRTTFRGGVHCWSGGPHPMRVRFDSRRTQTALFRDVAIGVHVDVRHEGALARRLDIWWRGGPGLDQTERGLSWEVAHEDADLLDVILSGEDSGWSMTVTADETLAARAGDATQHWSGSFTVPLRIDRSDGVAPPPLWWDPANPPVGLDE